MKLFIGILLLSFFLSCEILAPPEPPSISFNDVSQPYLNRYGQPEDTSTFTSGNYQVIDWWWWSKGFMVSFINSPYDNTNGWRVDSTYSFSPIDY